MSNAIKVVLKVVYYLFVLLVAIIVLRALVVLLSPLVGVSMFLVSVSILPLTAFVLCWFVYRVWAKVYVRAWHINHIRNSRYLREAAERGEHAN